MTTRGQINSNFYQIVDVDSDGNPTQVKPEYIVASGNAYHANIADVANVAYSVSGSNVTGYVGNSTHATVANTANSVSGANVNGQVPSAVYADTANVALNVDVANVIGIGNIATVNLDGNSNHVLYGNGVWANIAGGSNVANANYANYAGNAFSVTGSNVVGAVNLANYATIANSVAVGNVSGIGNIATINLSGNGSQTLLGNGTWGALPNTANANYANYAGNAFSVSGANVSGAVNLANYATVANSVTVANVSGIGNIATVNLTGDGSQTLLGNGTWGSLPNTANANYANYAGNAFSVTGSNVVGAVNLANYATVANSVAGSNVSGYVANATHSNVSDLANSVSVANVTGIGNIATVNLNGNSSTVLLGNGTWGSLGTAANANFANYAGNVTVSAQPNITSLGNVLEIQFSNTVTPVAAPNVGEMFWDTGEHTVTLGMENGVQQQIGLESYVYVKASSAITNGQAVMFTGANGDNVTAAPANASSVGFKSDYIIGIATQDIATNGFGYITVFGKVHGLNTNSYTVGDILWYDPTSTTGGLTNVQPTDPACQVQMAAVTKKAGGDGHIQVRVTPLTSLTNLTDVTITTPSTGQALVYNGSNIWINGIPNIANIAYSVAGGNVSGQVATALVAGTVYTNSQPNITSVGNLTSLNVTGNSNVGGELSVTGNIFTPANLSVSGNITGASLTTGGGNANLTAGTHPSTGYKNSGFIKFDTNTGASLYANTQWSFGSPVGTTVYFSGCTVDGSNFVNVPSATTAATVTASSQPNITSTGNLTSLNVTGNIVCSGYIMGYSYIPGAPNGAMVYVQNNLANITTQILYDDANTKVYIGNLTVNTSANLGSNSHVTITGGTNGQVLTTNGSGGLSWTTVSGSGAPGGSNTQLQFNDNGSFGGISNVTFNGTNISLGAITTVKITGGSSGQVIQTDGTGNLSFVDQSGGGGSTGFDQTFLLMGA